MQFILKEYDRWKIGLLEICGCFFSSSQKGKKYDHWKGKKINKD